MRAHRLPESRGALLNGFLVDADDEVMLITDGGVVIRTAVADISTQGRDASGVRVMHPGEEGSVAAVARVLAPEAEDEDDPTEGGLDPGPDTDGA